MAQKKTELIARFTSKRDPVDLVKGVPASTATPLRARPSLSVACLFRMVWSSADGMITTLMPAWNMEMKKFTSSF